MMELLGTPSVLRDYCVCYQIGWNLQWLYTGACEMRNLLDLPDAKRNDKARDFIRSDIPIVIKIIDVFPSIEGARACAAETPLWCNNNGREVAKVEGKVRCIDDDTTYDNASQAARAYNASTAAMSNHLNGKRYYRTVAGKRFERI